MKPRLEDIIKDIEHEFDSAIDAIETGSHSVRELAGHAQCACNLLNKYKPDENRNKRMAEIFAGILKFKNQVELVR